DGFQSQEHVFQSQFAPADEDVLILKKDIPAGFEVVLFADSPPLDFLGNRVPVLGMDERHVIDDEYTRLANAREGFGRALGADFAVVAPVKSPSAAERAVPRTAAREFDRGAWVERSDEVAFPPGYEISRGEHVVEAFDQEGRRPFALESDNAGKRFQGRAALGSLQQFWSDLLPLSANDAIEVSFGMLENLARREARAVPPATH